jgi:hypothetical protein
MLKLIDLSPKKVERDYSGLRDEDGSFDLSKFGHNDNDA